VGPILIRLIGGSGFANEGWGQHRPPLTQTVFSKQDLEMPLVCGHRSGRHQGLGWFPLLIQREFDRLKRSARLIGSGK
jgi:hypothetical protein